MEWLIGDGITSEEFNAQCLQVEKTKVPFAQAFKLIQERMGEKFPEFVKDIQRLSGFLYDSRQKMFGEGQLSKTELHVTDGVDLETYFAIGERPVPSCQSYASRGFMNAGLLSFVVDPNVRIIQIRQADGLLIARAVMRLLEDAEGKPQLFIERVYSNNSHHKIRQAIFRLAARKASKIGARVYSHGREGIENQEEALQTADLHSRGSRSPYVYTDAGGGKMKRGVYTIQGANQIRGA